MVSSAGEEGGRPGRGRGCHPAGQGRPFPVPPFAPSRGGRAERDAEAGPLRLKTFISPETRFPPSPIPLSLPAAAPAGVRGPAEPGGAASSPRPFFSSRFPPGRGRSELAGAPPGHRHLPRPRSRRDAERAGGGGRRGSRGRWGWRRAAGVGFPRFLSGLGQKIPNPTQLVGG